VSSKTNAGIKHEERKHLILKAMRELERPVWAGDVTARVGEQEMLRAAFRALVEEGKILRLPGAKGARAYYAPSE
jgi:hypothetical protein